MTLFKTVLKIINKTKYMLIIYTVILLSVTSLNYSSGNTNTLEFNESKPNVYIVNNDKEEGLTLGFINYIKEHANIIDIDINKEDAINDAIFYRDINYVIYIPKDFNKDIIDGKIPNIEYKASGDYLSSYTEMLIEKYVKTALIYKDYYQGKELNDKINNVIETKIDVNMKTTLDTSSLQKATTYFNFLSYAFLAGCVYSICMVLSSIKEKNVFKRTIISSYNLKKYNMIVFGANLLLILFMWLLYMGLSFILFKDLLLSNNGLLYIINSLIYIICALSIGYLIGNITQNKNAIGGIVNVVALGTSFLCGCFVPVEYMPESVLNISKALPTYYFVNNNEIVKTLEVFNFENIKPFLTNSLIIIGFTILFIILTNFIVNKKTKIG